MNLLFVRYYPRRELLRLVTCNNWGQVFIVVCFVPQVCMELIGR